MLVRIPGLFAMCFLLATPFASPRDTGKPSGLPGIIAKVKTCIGLVVVRTNVDTISYFGSAFLIDSTGIMATCRHVVLAAESTRVLVADTLPGAEKWADTIVTADTSQITVEMTAINRTFKAHIIAERKDRDIALLRLDIEQDSMLYGTQVPAIGPVEYVVEGVEVACTGHDLGQAAKFEDVVWRYMTTHVGIISCEKIYGTLQSPFLNQFQLDMLINLGASGSPVYRTEDGVVVGMQQSANTQPVEGLGIANCQPMWVILNLFADSLDRKPSARVLRQ